MKIAIIASVLSAGFASAFGQAQSEQPLLTYLKSAGFAPELYTGFKKCTISAKSVKIEIGSGYFTKVSTEPLTRVDLAKLKQVVAQLAGEPLVDLGPAPSDGGSETFAAFDAAKQIIIQGRRGDNFIERQSSNATGVKFMIDTLCNNPR